MFTHIASVANPDNGSAATITHGLTIATDQFLVAYINRDDATAIQAATSGGADWTEAFQGSVSGETSTHAMFYKITNDSEPATYSWPLGSVRDFHVLLKQFSFSGGTPNVVLAALEAINETVSFDAICDATAGRAVSDGDLSLVFGGKDRAVSGETFTAVDGGFTGIVGGGDNREAVGAHKIHTADETLSAVTFTSDATVTGADRTYSLHASFVATPLPLVVVTDVDTDEIIYKGQSTFTVTVTGVPEDVHSWGFRFDASGEEATAVSRSGDVFTLGITAAIQALPDSESLAGTFWFRPQDYVAP